MSSWIRQLRWNPVEALVKSEDKAVSYLARRDLLEQPVEPIYTLWKLQEVTKLLERQKTDGSWKYHGGTKDIRSQENYDQLETYRILGILVEKYGLACEHPAIQEAADFLFSFQTEEGDFRGIYGNQYTPNYTAAIMELLIKAGYSKDEQIQKGFNWLLEMRQNDGGWAIPTRTVNGKEALTLMKAIRKREPVKPDRSKPFSHLVTGIVLRAFAAHPDRRKTEEAKHAGKLLKSRFFKPDAYPDRRAPSYWTKFSYPFWFTDLISSLDALSQTGFTNEDPDVKKAVKWFTDNQQQNNLWKLTLLRTGKQKTNIHWVSLALCRTLKRLHKTPP